MEKQLEAERRQLESKSDVFRMHYQNQLLDLDISRTNMSLSRSMAVAPPPRVDMRHSGVFEGSHEHGEQQRQGQRQGQQLNHSHQGHLQGYDQQGHYIPDPQQQQDMQQLRRENQELQRQCEQQRQETGTLQLKLQQQQQQQQQQQSFHVPEHHLEEQVRQLKQNYQELQQQYEQQRQEASSLQMKLQQQQHHQTLHPPTSPASNNHLEEQVRQLKKNYQDLQQQYEHKRQEASTLLKLQQQQQQQPQQSVQQQRFASQTDDQEQQQLKKDCLEWQHQYELQRQEASSLQLKLQQAADTLDVLKNRAAEAHSTSESQKATIQSQKNLIAELEHECEVASKASHPRPSGASSPTTTDLESQVVGISRVRKLEAEIVRLQGALSQAQAQAREDHEQDSVLLQSMQHKFEALVANFESSRTEQNESFAEQEGTVGGLEDEVHSLKEVISMHEKTIAELQDQVKAMVDFNRQLEMKHSEEVSALVSEASGYKDTLSAANEIVDTQKSELQKLQTELDKQVNISRESGDNLVTERKEFKALKQKNQNLNAIIFKIDDTYRLQIRELRTALSRVKDNVVVLERSMESEVEVMIHRTEAFSRPLFDKIAKKYDDKLEGEKKRLTAAHMKEEKHLIGSLKKRLGKEGADENDATSVNSLMSQHSASSLSDLIVNQVVGHYTQVLKHIFEALSSSSIISAGSSREIMFYLESANIKNITEQHVGEKNSNSIGVVSAKLFEMLSRELNKYVKEKEKSVAQIELMSDMLRKEKINTAELKMSFHQSKTSRSVESNQSVSTGATSGVDLELQIRKLEAYIDELKLRHKMDIDRYVSDVF
jgi:hypothetical protein